MIAAPRPAEDVTRLLGEWNAGSSDAFDRLLPLVYGELRRLAAGQLRRRAPGFTLQTTALVHEAFLRLRRQRRVHWHDRGHFFAIAAKVMRRVAVDEARRRRGARRGGAAIRVPFDEVRDGAVAARVELPELDEALTRLAEVDVELAKLVELRFFVGLRNQELAATLGVSVPTVTRRWRSARAWLFRYLTAGGRHGA